LIDWLKSLGVWLGEDLSPTGAQHLLTLHLHGSLPVETSSKHGRYVHTYALKASPSGSSCTYIHVLLDYQQKHNITYKIIIWNFLMKFLKPIPMAIIFFHFTTFHRKHYLHYFLVSLLPRSALKLPTFVIFSFSQSRLLFPGGNTTATYYRIKKLIKKSVYHANRIYSMSEFYGRGQERLSKSSCTEGLSFCGQPNGS
jgi:hypothetical protein